MASVVGHQPPPFFKRGPAPLARLFFFLALALILFVVDLRYRYLESVRQAVSVVTHPLRMVAAAPIDFGRGLLQYFGDVAKLRADNEALQRRELEAARRVLRQETLEEENARLRVFLDMKQRRPVEGVVAEILYGAKDPFARRVVLDKGQTQGIAAGQAVVDDLGLVGQVTRVYPFQSEVTLITDKEQAVPVEIVRSGTRAVMFGAGEGGLELRYLSVNTDVQVGDEVVTSGLDGIFLPGLPVARVVAVERDSSYTFARILCAPVAGVERFGLVMVLGLREPALPQTAEAAQPVKAGAAGRSAGR